MRTGWGATLGGACVLLAGLLAWTIHSGLEEAPALPPPATTVAPEAAPDGAFALPPLERFQAIAARPLFVPERRPAAPQASEAPVTELALVGVVAERGRPRAVLRAGDGRTLTLGEGEVAFGWTIMRIAGDRVGIEKDGIARELRLTGRRAPAPPATDAAASPLVNGLP